MKVIAAPHEHKLITTNPQEVLEQREEQKEETLHPSQEISPEEDIQNLPGDIPVEPPADIPTG